MKWTAKQIAVSKIPGTKLYELVVWRKRRAEERAKERTMVDQHAVNELELYADNDSALYAQRAPFLENMRRKMKKGTYRADLGVKLWSYYVERAAKAYVKEFASAKDWARMFPPAVRREVAKHYELEARRELRGG